MSTLHFHGEPSLAQKLDARGAKPIAPDTVVVLHATAHHWPQFRGVAVNVRSCRLQQLEPGGKSQWLIGILWPGQEKVVELWTGYFERVRATSEAARPAPPSPVEKGQPMPRTQPRAKAPPAAPPAAALTPTAPRGPETPGDRMQRLLASRAWGAPRPAGDRR